MRPAKVTEEVVVEAGIELERKQISINGWSLRKLIGEGKPERLEKIWLAYKSEDPSTVIENVSMDEHILPLEIEESLTLFNNRFSMDMKNLITNSDILANQIADQKAKSIYKSLEESNQEIESQLKIATNMIDEADEEVSKLKSTISQHKSLESKFIALDKEFAKQSIKIDGLNNLLDERQKLVEEKAVQLQHSESSSNRLLLYIENIKKVLTPEQFKQIEKYN